MASITQAVERFEAEGIFPGSLSLTVRRIRQAAPDMLPPAAKGTGKNAPQVEPHHLTNFILAQAAHLPIEAVGAVEALRDLRPTVHEDFVTTSDDGLPFMSAVMVLAENSDQSLWVYLAEFIKAAAEPQMRDAMRSVAGHQWTLTLCAEGPFATISQRVNNRLEVVTFGERVFAHRAQRLVALPFQVITTAGELWQDTCERQGLSPTGNSETSPKAPEPTP